MTAMEIIRLTGGEFKNVDDVIIEKMMEIVRPMVSRKQFGKLYEQGLAYLVCHKLKMPVSVKTRWENSGLSASASLLEACLRAAAASALEPIRVPTSQRMPNSA